MFFFSSRRRHTRFKCDWSSDVCSSDLSPLDIANRIQILGHFGAVARTEPLQDAVRILEKGVKDAALTPDSGESHFRIRAVAVTEEVFEYGARLVLHRHWRGWCAPRERGRGSTAITSFALASCLGGVQREFQRSQLGVLAAFFRSNLIQRSSVLYVGA